MIVIPVTLMLAMAIGVASLLVVYLVVMAAMFGDDRAIVIAPSVATAATALWWLVALGAIRFT
mgnify:CR=1 FL=1